MIIKLWKSGTPAKEDRKNISCCIEKVISLLNKLEGRNVNDLSISIK